jgi:hypothetical protein
MKMAEASTPRASQSKGSPAMTILERHTYWQGFRTGWAVASLLATGLLVGSMVL